MDPRPWQKSFVQQVIHERLLVEVAVVEPVFGVEMGDEFYDGILEEDVHQQRAGRPEEIDAGIVNLSARQFNARYPLQMKRQLKAEQEEAEPEPFSRSIRARSGPCLSPRSFRGVCLTGADSLG